MYNLSINCGCNLDLTAARLIMKTEVEKHYADLVGSAKNPYPNQEPKRKLDCGEGPSLKTVLCVVYINKG